VLSLSYYLSLEGGQQKARAKTESVIEREGRRRERETDRQTERLGLP
jgi:hypothetical protein